MGHSGGLMDSVAFERSRVRFRPLPLIIMFHYDNQSPEDVSRGNSRNVVCTNIPHTMDSIEHSVREINQLLLQIFRE